MRELLIAGILYLTGVGILLLLKPQLIFNDRGAWKEFGIGRNPDSYTWMPFWLFCIFWALISYSLVFIIIRKIELPSQPEKISLLERRPYRATVPSVTGLRRGGLGRAPAPAYVMNSPHRNDVARYIYYGPPEPEMIRY